MIRIDQEFESLIPPLSEDEYRQLEQNCIKEGIRDALIVWPQQDGRNILVDGHNRWKIAADHGGLPFQIKQMVFQGREEAKAWIIRNQFGRRNLSAYDRSVLVLKLKPMIQAEAKKRQNLGLKSDEGGRTDKQLAEIAKVGKDTIRKVEVVENNAPEEIKEKARSGQISVNEAYRQTTNIMRPLKKTDIAKQAAEQHKEFEEKKNSNVVSMKDMTADKENRRILALEFSKRLTKASSAINDIVILQGDLKKIVSELTEEEKADSKAIIKNTMKVLTELFEMIGG